LSPQLGLSLSDIAKAAGVNPSTVHAWPARRAASQADKLERLYSGPERRLLLFLTEGAVKYLHETYLPWQERFEHTLWRQTNCLFPCEELTIYR
jgi:AcrR family transcriptional regulator